MPSSANLDYRNTNSLWGSVWVETLHRLGLRQAVISPGSRSTALTMAFARHPGIECIPVLDERSAAFFALGLAKRGHRPVALVCTSGTAGANYFPAIIEARESGVPLLVITADRPPEMRECRSGQTIDQQKLYGDHVNFYHEVAVPVADLPMLRYLRQTLVHAWERTQWPDAGPVHLNVPFRDPLPPLADGTTKSLKKSLQESVFFAAVQPPVRTRRQVELAGFPTAKRGVIVAGPAGEGERGRGCWRRCGARAGFGLAGFGRRPFGTARSGGAIFRFDQSLRLHRAESKSRSSAQAGSCVVSRWLAHEQAVASVAGKMCAGDLDDFGTGAEFGRASFVDSSRPLRSWSFRLESGLHRTSISQLHDDVAPR